VGALEALRAATGDDGIVGRARSNPRWIVVFAGAAILVLAWIGWAIHVASSDGARAGLGVVIAWPAMLAALALISLPFIGGYLLIRRLSEGGGEPATAEADPPEDHEEAEDESENSADEDEPEDSADEDEPEDSADEDEPEDEETEEDSGDEDEESDGDADEDPGDESESDSEAESSAAS
jgi:hypothetical protein